MPKALEPQSQEPERKVAVYQLTYFYCPEQPKGLCDQIVELNKIISVTDKGSQMQTYAEAFKNASDGAPLCPIHDLQMMPQLVGMTNANDAADVPEV